MSNDVEPADPEDMFADTRMSFGDHIEDLRAHLIRAMKGFILGMILGIWPLGTYVLAIIVAPVEQQLNEYEERKREAEIAKANELFKRNQLDIPSISTKVTLNKKDLLDGLGLKSKEEDAEVTIAVRADIADPLEFSNQVTRTQGKVVKQHLKTMHITEAFFVYFKVALLTGLVISSPWVFYHVWMFIAAGLYPHEKRLVNYYLPFSLFLFIGGVVLCQFVVMPRAVAGLLMFNEWLGITPDLRLNEWLGFALMMPLVFGIAFQTPLVMMFMHRVGIVTIQQYRDYRRISWFLMAVACAVFTPISDAVSMLWLWVPMVGLYELGILLCIWQGEQPTLFDWGDEEKSDELVEV